MEKLECVERYPDEERDDGPPQARYKIKKTGGLALFFLMKETNGLFIFFFLWVI
jgi:hypothetical protein